MRGKMKARFDLRTLRLANFIGLPDRSIETTPGSVPSLRTVAPGVRARAVGAVVLFLVVAGQGSLIAQQAPAQDWPPDDPVAGSLQDRMGRARKTAMDSSPILPNPTRSQGLHRLLMVRDSSRATGRRGIHRRSMRSRSTGSRNILQISNLTTDSNSGSSRI